MKYTAHNQFLYAEPEGDDVVVEQQGLSERMAEAFKGVPDGEAPLLGRAEPEPVNEPAIKEPAPDDAPPAKEPEKPKDGTPAAEEEEEEFPKLGAVPEPKVKDEEFDADAFDKKTEEEVKGMPDDQANRWKILKGKVKEAKMEAAAAKEIAANVKPSPAVEAELTKLRADAAEAEALRQRNNELLAANDATSVRESDAFKEAVTKPVAEMEEIVVKMAEHSGVDANSLFDVITESNVAKQDALLDQLETKIGARMAMRLSGIADSYKSIQVKSADMVQNAGKTIEANRIAQQEAADKEVSRVRESYKAATRASFEEYGSRIPGFTDSSGTLTDLAESVLDSTNAIDPSTLSPSDLGYMAFSANALPAARKAILELQKEIQLLKGGRKPAAALSGEAGSIPETDDGEEDGFLDRLKRANFGPDHLV